MYLYRLVLFLYALCRPNGYGLVNKTGITVTSSSTHTSNGDRWTPDKAVDGDARRNPNACSCCAATNQDYEPWYKVDLGQEYNIQFVDVIGRDSSGHTLLNMRVSLGTNSQSLTAVFQNTLDVYVVNHTLQVPRNGRYMELILVGTTQYFVICELFVYSECDDRRYGRDCKECGQCLNGVPCNKVDGTCQSCAAGYEGANCDQECIAGKYGLDCTENCGNCKTGVTCDKVDGSCTDCLDGYLTPLCKECEEGRYGRDCTTCGQCLGGAHCNKTDGTCASCAAGYTGTKCDQECSHGKYGPDCTESCGNCKNGVTCDKVDGSCTDCQNGYIAPLCKECEDGHYGRDCTKCGQCLNGAPCNKVDGSCTSCAAGYKGPMCDQECSHGKYGPDCTESCGNCKNGVTCDKVDGSCTDCQNGYIAPLCKECSHGKYGPDCTESCGNCKNGVTCDKVDGSCTDCQNGYIAPLCKECEEGRYGRDCTTCGQCLGGAHCNKTDGTCASCAAGYTGTKCDQECTPGEYGPGCSETCGNCKDGAACNKFDGSCTECQDGYKPSLCKLCIDGRYGIGCDSFCHCGNGICNKTSGVCPSGGCKAGYRGPNCNIECDGKTYGANCGETCGSCFNKAICDIFNGSCPQSYCAAGFRGDKCKQICAIGSYGQNCSQPCGNCFGGNVCETLRGACLQGCTDGYNGTLCTTKCSAGTFGRNCESTCGNCSNGDNCKFDNGHCERGCEPGLQPPTCLAVCGDRKYGQNCSMECGECAEGNDCDKVNGTCDACAGNYMPPYCLEEKQVAGPEQPGDSPLGVIIGAVVGVVVAAVVIIVIIFIVRRRRKNNGPPEKFSGTDSILVPDSKPVYVGQPNPNPVPAKKEGKRKTEEVHVAQAAQTEPAPDADDSNSIYYSFLAKKTDLKICQLWDYVYLKKKDKCVLFYQEYGQLPSGLKYPHDTAMVPRNRELNRYRGLYAYDHSRVTLEVDSAAETDYINACFINGYEKPRKFIASQGPTKKMRNDFWRMIWQQKSKVIIMLTNLIELGSEKCVLYWPDKEKSDEVTFGKITIKLVSEDVRTDYTIRQMEIFKDDPEDRLSVTQFHFISWPDKSTPDSSWSLVKFWRKVSEDTRNLADCGPMVVHCSAGIGRTGTYIALDVAYHKARSEGAVKIKEVVTTLREQRVSMVQTADQYVYIHDAIADAFLFGTLHIWSGQLEEVYEYFNQPMDGKPTTRLETQFNFIKESIEDKRSVQSSTEEGENIYNNIFNKQRDLKSGEDYRPKSKSMKYVQEVGALILPNHEEKGTFIISKCPEDSRMTEFWSLVQEQNVKTIVSLGATATNKRSSVLGNGNGMIKDKFGLNLDEERKTSTFIERKFRLRDNENQDVKVTHFEFSNLTVNEIVPKDTCSMLQLLEAVMNCQRQFSETEPILVYCKSGFQHCGLACVLLSELNRMNREGGQINVVHTVKSMKERHDDILGTFEQYQYVYDALLEHVRDSTYQNQ